MGQSRKYIKEQGNGKMLTEIRVEIQEVWHPNSRNLRKHDQGKWKGRDYERYHKRKFLTSKGNEFLK